MQSSLIETPPEAGGARSERLRIGLVAPPWFAVPPSGYGGTERVVSYLADGLARRGHDVTLFASGGSRSLARVVSVYDEPPSADLGDPLVELVHTSRSYADAAGFDVIHDHTVTGLAAAQAVQPPVVHTMHGALDPPYQRLYSAVSPPVHLVAISEHQRSTAPAGLSMSVIHNAIDVEATPFGATPGEYLLFVGRMSADKGILDAIEIARRAERPLMVIAKVNEAPERQYFDTCVLPALRRADADLLLQPPPEVKLRAYKEALATLFPIHWPEPFGLVMIESMAAGTPVIAFPRGAVPEVIAHGKSGWICETVEEAAAAVPAVAELDRGACREHVRAHFDTGTAVARHEALYYELASGKRALRGRRNGATGVA